MINSIRILGHEFKIIFDPTLEQRQAVSGRCVVGLNELSINANHSLSQQRDTLFHECIEAVNSCLELKLEHPQITALGCAFQSIFADNPHLLDFLKQKPKT